MEAGLLGSLSVEHTGAAEQLGSLETDRTWAAEQFGTEAQGIKKAEALGASLLKVAITYSSTFVVPSA